MLVKVFGETKNAGKARASEKQPSDNEFGVIIVQIRKYLSLTFVKAQSLMPNKLAWILGTGSQGRPTSEDGACPGKDRSLYLNFNCENLS